mmetsp:Transcript_56500/g.113387  ORF Transcript_56500/g.113387 Transcript_56500/m.113387 type:complete len:83 (-) Transcript_56500:134-382(-)
MPKTDVEGALSPERHPWLWAALLLAVVAALAVLFIFVRLQYAGGAAFNRKPEKAYQMKEMRSCDDLDEEQDGRGGRELRRKR